ncbi:MAG TPA: PIG-L family deacetylase [Terriglobales bacterium]|nr:PIG-L family deacetylase [Terriglobales bacterium]
MDDESRRKFLRNAAWALPAAAIASAAPGELSADNGAEQKKLKVIVAGGHPGDPEYGCGGAVARYTESGHAVTLLYLNRGEGGIAGKTGKEAAAIRSAEAAKACELLKATPLFADQIDGQSIVDKAHYDSFARIIEGEKPDVLFTQWPIDGHPDHRATSMLCYDAWLRMGKSFGFYYYEVSDGEDTLMFSPEEYVDITGAEPRKRAACYAHASQSPDHFYALQDQVARFRGLESGVGAAEAFVRHVQSRGGMLPE